MITVACFIASVIIVCIFRIDFNEWQNYLLLLPLYASVITTSHFYNKVYDADELRFTIKIILPVITLFLIFLGKVVNFFR